MLAICMRPVGSATQMESSGRKRQESVQNATECVGKRATSEMRELLDECLPFAALS